MRGKKRERILRILLTEKEPLSKNELSKRAGCVRSWVIAFLQQLERMKLVEGTTVVNHKKLFDYWRTIHKKPKYKSYLIKKPLELLQKTKLEYALTTYQAENIVQHYLFPSGTDIYVKEEDLEQWHKLLSKQGLVGGGNVRLFIDDEHVLYKKRKLQKVWVVGIPQLIIDLFTEGAMCVEAAEMLIERMYNV